MRTFTLPMFCVQTPTATSYATAAVSLDGRNHFATDQITARRLAYKQDGKMKHQISLQRTLLYIALFAFGMGMIRFAFASFVDALIQISTFMLGVVCVSAAIFCPVGYLIAGDKGEVNAYLVAFLIAALSMGFLAFTMP